MESYNPSEAPDPHEWQAKTELERIALVEQFHRRNAQEAPAAAERAHAAIHVVVENQIALGIKPVGATVARLVSEGLDRHEAIHAVGAVLSEDMFALARGDEQSWNEGRYRRRLENLSAKRWKKGKW
ncbi:MAG: hypothetical protein PVG38_01375 [Gammaproteobacteria bacterium]|jgi:hypothetical protein